MPSDEIAKRYRIPTLMSAMTQPSANGTTAQPAKASVAVTSGARMKITLFAPDGMMISLNMNLKASAMVWSRPKGPTTFGPRRSATAAQILRSARMKKAMETRSGN